MAVVRSRWGLSSTFRRAPRLLMRSMRPTPSSIDLVALSQNYNTNGTGTWSIGDFNYDGNVNFLDLVLLSQNYNTTLPPAPAAPVAASQPVQAPVTATPLTAAAVINQVVKSTAVTSIPVTTKAKSR